MKSLGVNLFSFFFPSVEREEECYVRGDVGMKESASVLSMLPFQAWKGEEECVYEKVLVESRPMAFYSILF